MSRKKNIILASFFKEHPIISLALMLIPVASFMWGVMSFVVKDNIEDLKRKSEINPPRQSIKNSPESNQFGDIESGGDTIINVSQESGGENNEPSLSSNDLKSSSPFEYTINEHQPQFVQDAQASLSVNFQKIYGADVVSLNISPISEKASVHAVRNGDMEKFKSSKGVFNVQILDIDYSNKKVVVQISRKS
ncbi:hypothetical protein GMMP15_560082 [Candidatus Magnetomoraceae bacterium gMMP-15]